MTERYAGRGCGGGAYSPDGATPTFSFFRSPPGGRADETCICTAILVFNSPQLTVSISMGWEELKTESDIQEKAPSPPHLGGDTPREIVDLFSVGMEKLAIEAITAVTRKLEFADAPRCLVENKQTK